MNWNEYREGLHENGLEPVEITIKIFDRTLRVQKVFPTNSLMVYPKMEAEGAVKDALRDISTAIYEELDKHYEDNI